MSDIKRNIESVRTRIASAARRAGIAPESVTLVAVSKTKPVEMVEEAIAAGAAVFGENYIQEGILKADRFQDEASWHFIGHLQKNKARLAAEYFDMIESIDSGELARKVSDACGRLGRKIDVLMQIHFGDEESKHGFMPGDAERAADIIRALPNINLKGLMTIPPLVSDPEENRRYFASMREMGSKIFAGEGHILSMGMTGDLEVAIEEGSNMVRVGTAIFGRREYAKP